MIRTERGGCNRKQLSCQSDGRVTELRRAALQEFIHDKHVDPPAVELALLAIHAHRAEADALVERDAGRVERKRRQHELVIADAPRELDQSLQELTPDALAAPSSLDVHGEIGHVIVGRARIEAVEARPAHHLAGASATITGWRDPRSASQRPRSAASRSSVSSVAMRSSMPWL